MHRDLVQEALATAETYDREVAEDFLRTEMDQRPRDLIVFRQAVNAACALRLRALEREAAAALRALEEDLAGVERARAAAYGLPQRRTHVPPRQRVAGLVLTALIGVGGFGGVYQAEADEGRVAVRCFDDAFVKDAACLARIRARTARWIATAPHARVVAARALLEEDGEVALVMEHGGVRTLERALAAGPLGGYEILTIAIDLCRAILATPGSALDLRPCNVFLDREGRARLSDIGLPPMAPGGTSVEAHAPSGVYRMGVLLHEMVAGGPSRLGGAPKPMPMLGPLGEVVARCLGSAEDRFLEIAQLEAELERLHPRRLVPREEPPVEARSAEPVADAPAPWKAGSPAPPEPLDSLDSLDAVEAAITRDPGNLHIWQRRLELQREARALRRALGIGEEPDSVYDFVREGRAYLAFDDPAEALRFFDARLEEDPASPDAWLGRARALEELGRTDEASEAWIHFEKAGGRRRT